MPTTPAPTATASSSALAAEPPTDPAFDYDLSGILVHTGTADSGHYYSFIKDRNSGRWFQFNDSHVSPFDVADIRTQCFGGYETVITSDSTLHYTHTIVTLSYATVHTAQYM